MMGGNNDTGGLERTASGELKLQRELMFETAEAKFSNAMSAVPKYLGNTTYARDASPARYPMAITTTPTMTMHQQHHQYPSDHNQRQRPQDPS